MALKTLNLDLKVGETVTLTGPASVRLESKSGALARLAIMADESVRIERPHNPAAQQAAQGINAGNAQERAPAYPSNGRMSASAADTTR